MGGDELGSGNDVTGDLAGGAGDEVFIGNGADDSTGFKAILDHAEGQVGVAELGGDAGVEDKEIGDEAGDKELADVDGGEEAEVTGEGGMFTVEALLGIVGKGEEGTGIFQEAEARFGEAHAVGVATDEGKAGAILEQAEVATEVGLGDAEGTGSGGDATGFGDADEGAKEREIVECGHAVSE